MKIVVLDGYTLNPGDLSWDALKALGDVKVFDRTTPEELVQRAGNAEIVLTNKTPLHREEIRKLTKLKYIGVLATGCNVVNVDAAKKRSVVVTNVPGYATSAVAEMVFALMFEWARHVNQHAFSVTQGRWTRNPDFCYWLRPLTGLDGLTLGIVGFGNIGKAVAARAHAFGMKILVYTRTVPSSTPFPVTFTDMDAVFRESDVVSLHCPLGPETELMVNAYRIELMKRTAFLINTSRGGLVDEDVLAEALKKNRISGAGLDVLSEEPPPAKNPLLKLRNCIITPHMAWGTQRARQQLMDVAVANVKAFLDGKPQNVV